MNEIISKWVVRYKDHYLCITESKEVYDINSKEKLVEYWNNGVISYRYPRTAKRIGVRTINKHCIKQRIIIQEFCPF